MGFPEIKNMFEMYVDGKLDVEPLPNHLDRIQLGKIANAYRKYKKVKPQKKTLEEQDKEKAIEDQHYVITLFDYYIQNNTVPNDCQWVYIYLEERLTDFKFNPMEKRTLFKLGKDQKLTNEEAKDKAKRHLIMRYFDRLHAKDKHIKDLI